jgi:hypothetical protein
MVDVKKRKRKAKKPSRGPTQTQNVIVNIGSRRGYTTKRRSGTQATRSVPPQVIYQPSAIPLQPNYNTQLNDLRHEIKASMANPLIQRTGNLAYQEGVQGGLVQAQTQDARRSQPATTPLATATPAAPVVPERRGFIIPKKPVPAVEPRPVPRRKVEQRSLVPPLVPLQSAAPPPIQAPEPGPRRGRPVGSTADVMLERRAIAQEVSRSAEEAGIQITKQKMP